MPSSASIGHTHSILFSRLVPNFMLDLHIQTERPTGFTQSLRVTRVIPINAKIFDLAALGDVEGMKILLSRGDSSPFDVSNGTGFTSLKVKFLINDIGSSL